MQKVALILTLSFIVLTAPFCFGQKKVKYKDIWALLNTKQYEAAELFLKDYLKNNDDNPNAFLYMGIIYHEKSGKDDVLKQTKQAIAHMDSAIYFYNKAHKTITEKEIKRNSEYYQSYNRRDLRTGEFGVKLSDIQFDLEKKMEGLHEKIDRVKMIRHYFALTDSLYKKANLLYVKIQEPYAGEKEFYLRADTAMVENLAVLAVRFDSCMKAFDQYKASVATVGKIGYNQHITANEIRNLKTDGISGADFYKDDLQLWDYKAFANQARQAIEKEIFPIREHLITYDIEINKLRERLVNDSVSVKHDLISLVDKLLMEQLKKYDEHPLPMDVFSIKIADLEYRSTLLENSHYRDSLNVHFRLALAKKELKSITKLDSLATGLVNRDLDKEAENYAYFVSSTYGNINVLKSFINGVKGYAERERQLKQGSLAEQEKSLRWIVNALDSIPLFMDSSSTRFKPLAIVREQYTSGIQYRDSLQASGYFYTITPSRVPDIKISFPLDKLSFKQSQFKNARTLTYSDASGQIYFVLLYSEKSTKDNKYPATLAKIYRSDGLAWYNNYVLPYVPREIDFRSETGELFIRSDEQQNIIDKNGKMR